MYDVSKSIEGQKKYCQEAGHPHFAPRNGVCWSCGMNIYEPHTTKVMSLGEERNNTTGITVEEASSTLVTGCPHCNRSYCD